jgi:hypothetical protein
MGGGDVLIDSAALSVCRNPCISVREGGDILDMLFTAGSAHGGQAVSGQTKILKGWFAGAAGYLLREEVFWERAAPATSPPFSEAIINTNPQSDSLWYIFLINGFFIYFHL